MTSGLGGNGVLGRGGVRYGWRPGCLGRAGGGKWSSPLRADCKGPDRSSALLIANRSYRMCVGTIHFALQEDN